MAIVVKHGQNASAAAYGAYGGGQGQRHSQDTGRALDTINQKENRRLRGNMHSSSLRARRMELDESREFQLDRDEAGREFQLDRDENAQTDRRDNFEWEYSAKQRIDFDRKAQAYEDAVKSGNYSPDELAEMKDQFISNEMGIEPVPRLKRKSQWPEGQGIGQSWTTPDGRFLMTRDDKGNEKQLADMNPPPTMKDIATLYQQASNALEGVDGTTASPESIEKWVDNAIKLQQKYSKSRDGWDDLKGSSVEEQAAQEEPLPDGFELWTGTRMRAYRRAKEKREGRGRVVRRRQLHDGSFVNVKQLSDGRWVEVESE